MQYKRQRMLFRQLSRVTSPYYPISPSLNAYYIKPKAKVR
jgi:hypothetical protein